MVLLERIGTDPQNILSPEIRPIWEQYWSDIWSNGEVAEILYDWFEERGVARPEGPGNVFECYRSLAAALGKLNKEPT